MKKSMTALWLLLAPTVLLAQTATKPAAAPAKPAASAAKPAAKAAAKPKAKPAPSKVEIKSTATNMAAGIEAAEAALTPGELAIAQRVHTGLIPCELGASVLVEADPKAPGFFNVTTKNIKYRMFPITTSTGAIRLEDQRAGAVWMQLGNKSMLLNQKLGQRQADECVSPQQALVIEQMKGKPAQNVLEPLPAPVAAPAPAVAASGAASGAVLAPTTVPGVVYPTGPTPPARKPSAAK